MGYADGQLSDGVGCPVQRDAGAGPLLGSRGGTDGKDYWSGGAGGGTVSSTQWTQLLSGTRRKENGLLWHFLFFPPRILCVNTAGISGESGRRSWA